MNVEQTAREFFRPYFRDPEEATAFVDRCEAINRDYRPPELLDDSTPKIMMHQTVRLISMGDRVRDSAGGGDSMTVFFLVLCMEAVQKNCDHVKSMRNPDAAVRRFLNLWLAPEDVVALRSGFLNLQGNPMKLNAIASLLYGIRCDVAHEGIYWRFSFPERCMGPTELNLHPGSTESAVKIVRVAIPLRNLKDIVVRACIRATEQAFREWKPGPQVSGGRVLMKRKVGRLGAKTRLGGSPLPPLSRSRQAG